MARDEVSVGMVWPRMVAVRAQFKALGPSLDAAVLRQKEAERKAREADQAWSALIDTIGTRGFDVKKAAADRRALKSLRAAVARAKGDATALRNERERLDTLFASLFDEAVTGPGLFDQGVGEAGGGVLGVSLADVLHSSLAEMLAEDGLATVQDVVEKVGGRAKLEALPGKGPARKHVARAIAAVLVSAKIPLPAALEPFAPQAPDAAEPDAEGGEGEDAGSGGGE